MPIFSEMSAQETARIAAGTYALRVDKGERVFQLNIQLFAMTAEAKDKKNRTP